MSKNMLADKELLVATIAATLQDLRPPAGLFLDPFPSRNAPQTEYNAWIDRHTTPQKGAEGAFYGDDVYDHCTARAVLYGMPFDVLDERFTLISALEALDMSEPESLIETWKQDFNSAADCGDRLDQLTHARNLPKGWQGLMVESDVDDDDQEAMLTMPLEGEDLATGQLPISQIADVYSLD